MGAILQRLRPKLRYQGVDGSEYVVRRYGRARNIRLGRFGALETLNLEGPYDLIVCADVLHYVRAPEARAGLATLAKLLGDSRLAMADPYSVPAGKYGKRRL